MLQGAFVSGEQTVNINSGLRIFAETISLFAIFIVKEMFADIKITFLTTNTVVKS